MSVKHPAVSSGVFDPRGIRQIRAPAPVLDSLLAGMNRLPGMPQIGVLVQLHFFSYLHYCGKRDVMARYTSTNDERESTLQKEYMEKAASYVADLEKSLGRRPQCCVTTFGCQMNFVPVI